MARRQRDYALERAQRDAKYQKLGYSGGYNQFDSLRRKGLAVAGERRQVTPNVGGKTLARSNPTSTGTAGSLGPVAAALAAAGGRQVQLSVVIRGRRYDLLSKGGWNAGLVRQRVARDGGLLAFAYDQAGSALEILYGDTSFTADDIEEVQITY